MAVNCSVQKKKKINSIASTIFFFCSGTSRSWSSKIFEAWKAIEDSSHYIASWHAPLQHSSDFLRQVARYAPATGLQQGCPAAFIWLSWACDKVSVFLAEAATTVQGASALGRMVGRCTSVIGNKLKAEPGEEPEPDKKDGTAKVLITSCDQVTLRSCSWVTCS